MIKAAVLGVSESQEVRLLLLQFSFSAEAEDKEADVTAATNTTGSIH